MRERQRGRKRERNREEEGEREIEEGRETGRQIESERKGHLMLLKLNDRSYSEAY